MKRFFCMIATALICVGAFAQQTPDFSVLEKSKHPRLIAGEQEFKEYVKAVNRVKNKPLATMHKALMLSADDLVKNPDKHRFVYKKDKAGRITGKGPSDFYKFTAVLAYAYRYSKNIDYVLAEERFIKQILEYPDWVPDHFLNTAHFAGAFALAYDWMYKALDPALKKQMIKMIQDYCFAPAKIDKYAVWRRMTNNHNQVDNCHLVCTAIATYECHPEEARYLILDAIKTNPACQAQMYSPDGNYPEGPGYWRYGTQHEVIMLTALQKTFGSTFGLDEIPGFSRTGEFALYVQGNTRKWFNFQDSNARQPQLPELWYFAWKAKDYSIAFREIEYLLKSDRAYVSNLFAPFYALYAKDYDDKEVTPPSARVFGGRGNTPVVLARTGWGSKDLFLGVKGGRANFTHGHMDAGSFVFDAYGVRWASELDHKPYSKDEVGLKKLGASLWKRYQGEVRWRIMSNDNHFHNTLTVNDKEHVFNGITSLEEIIDEPARIGGRFNMSAAFFDLEKAERTAVIRDDSYLEVTDVIKAADGKNAEVRWTLMTEGTPEIVADGILLTKKGVTMKLSASGAEVKYRTWSTDPKDYPGNPVADFDEKPKDIYCCGFTFTAPADKELSLVTTLIKQ